MKYQRNFYLVFIGLHLVISSTFSQSLFKWQKLPTPTSIRTLVMRGNTLYAFTNDAAFASTDYGNTWSGAGYIPDTYYHASRDSICIYTPAPKYYIDLQFNPYGVSLAQNTHIFRGSNGVVIQGFTSTYQGGVGAGGIKILNDNTIMYIRSGVIYENGQPINIYEPKTIFNDNSTIDKYLSNVRAHMDTFFIKVNNDKLKFYGDTSFQFLFEKSLPFTGVSGYSFSLDTIYKVTPSGKTYLSGDLGDSWEADSIPFSGIDSYYSKDGLHIIRTSDGYFLSKDFKNYFPFPALDSSYLEYKRFYIFGDFVFAIGSDREKIYRSFDKGNTWEIVIPQGVSSLKIDKLFVFDDTLYCRSENELYKQVCNDHFEISPNNRFLNNWSPVFYEDLALRVSYPNTLEKFDVSSQEWMSLDTNFSDVSLKGIFLDNQHLYAYGALLQESMDGGINWNPISHPQPNKKIEDFQAFGDLFLCNYYFSDRYFSTDHGLSWTPIDGKIMILDSTIYVATDNTLKKYNDINDPPVATYTIEEHFAPYSFRWHYFQAGDNIFCTYWSSSVQWGAEAAPFKIYLFRKDYPGWRDVTSEFPKWQEIRFNHAFFDEYRWKRSFSDVLYRESDKSLYFTTYPSGVQRTSVAFLDTTGIAYQELGSYCVGDSLFPTTSAGRYGDLVYHPCQPDSAYFVTTTYAVDTTIQLCLSPNSTVEYGGQSFAKAGNYQVNLVNTNGCDTLGHIEVYEAKDSIFSIIDTLLCGGDSLFYDGNYYTSPGIYYDTIVQNGPCNSVVGIIELRSTFFNSLLEKHSYFACTGASFYFNGHAYTSPGIYYDTLSEITPCSWYLAKVELFDEPFEDVISIYPCGGVDSITFEGAKYSVPGSYYLDTLSAVMGCDSVHRVLSVHESDIVYHDFQSNEVYCYGDTVFWFDQVVTSSGFYLDTLENTCGNDSVIIHKPFTFNTPTFLSENFFICEGDTLFAHQMAIVEPGLYPFDTVLSVSTSCDSIVYSLDVKSTVTDTSFVTADTGVYVSGVLINGDTTFTQVIPSLQFGCDSIHNVFVVKLPVATTSLEIGHLKVFPNPTYDKLFVQGFPKSTRSIAVKNVLGQKVYSHFDFRKPEIEIDVSKMPTGLYILELSYGYNQRHFIKFVKVRE